MNAETGERLETNHSQKSRSLWTLHSFWLNIDTINRLKPQAEKTIAEEQAGFKAGRSTTEQIFNLRILCEKYLQHEQDIYHVFIDFKKAFNRFGMQLCGRP